MTAVCNLRRLMGSIKHEDRAGIARDYKNQPRKMTQPVSIDGSMACDRVQSEWIDMPSSAVLVCFISSDRQQVAPRNQVKVIGTRSSSESGAVYRLLAFVKGGEGEEVMREGSEGLVSVRIFLLLRSCSTDT